MPRGSLGIRRLTEYHDESRDNFDRNVSTPLRDLIDVAGEKDFTPERLRYFKDGSRRYLQYGSDENYSETNQGHKLSPDSGMTLTLRTSEKAAYQVGYDLWPTMSYRVLGSLSSGDAVGGGYGVIDLANFDPATISYTGSDADGYFWYHTKDTGLEKMEIALVQNGTVLDNRTVDRYTPASVFTILEQRLNWYAVGPSVFREIYTDRTVDELDPQRNEPIGSVSNDDGKGPAAGSHRAGFAIHQASGNTGLELEVGSIGIRTPGPITPQFKTKGHSMDLENTNTTSGTYQVCAAMRIDPAREEVKFRYDSIDIVATPGSSTNRTRVLLQAVGAEETDADTKSFSTPEEHNDQNSVLREVEDNSITGPVANDSGNDASGPTTSNTMTNPGGIQLGRDSVTPEGTGSKTNVANASQFGNRELYPGDICLVLVDSDTSGTVEIDVQSSQNS